jgi:hypothetical protein
MVKSNFCVTHSLPEEALYDLGECPLDMVRVLTWQPATAKISYQRADLRHSPWTGWILYHQRF